MTKQERPDANRERARKQWAERVKAHQEFRNQRRLHLTEGQDITIQQTIEAQADGSSIRAEDIPAYLTEMEVQTSLDTIDGRCFYGGPGASETCKRENQDSIFAGVASDGSVFLGVVDGINQTEKSGLIGSVTSNCALRERLHADSKMDEVFSAANRMIYKEGCSASAAVARMTPEGKLEIGTVGNTKAIIIVGDRIFFSSSPQNKAFAADRAPDYYKHPGKDSATESLGRGPGTGHKCSEFQFKEGEDVTVILTTNGGLGDVISNHEILELFKQHKGDLLAFQEALFRKAYSRNNSKDQFTIQHDSGTRVEMPAMFGRGDNITVQVAQFKVPTIFERAQMSSDRKERLKKQAKIKAEQERLKQEQERRQQEEAKKCAKERARKSYRSAGRYIDPRDPTFEPSHYKPSNIEEALIGLGFEVQEIELLRFKTTDPEVKTQQKRLILKRYRSIVSKYHPDRNPTDKYALIIFKKATEDYHYLLKELELAIAV